MKDIERNFFTLLTLIDVLNELGYTVQDSPLRGKMYKDTQYILKEGEIVFHGKTEDVWEWLKDNCDCPSISKKNRAGNQLTPANCDPSEEFVRAFRGYLTSLHVCACGRTWFSSKGGQSIPDGKLIELLRNQQEHPDLYCDKKYKSVDVMFVSGESFVVGCPCNLVTRHERFIKASATEIIRYLGYKKK